MRYALLVLLALASGCTHTILPAATEATDRVVLYEVKF